MAERVLSPRVLNRALPARRLLLERADLPPVRAVERVGGLQTQYAPSGYVGSVPTFLVDGQVAGTWRLVDGRIVRSAFHQLPVAAVRELGEEAERPAAFYANG